MVNILIKIPHSKREYIITSNEFQYILNEVKKNKKQIVVAVGEGEEIKVKLVVIDHIRTMTKDDIQEIVQLKFKKEVVEVMEIKKYYSAIAYGTIQILLRFLVEREPRLSDSINFEQLGNQYEKMNKLLAKIEKQLS